MKQEKIKEKVLEELKRMNNDSSTDSYYILNKTETIIDLTIQETSKQIFEEIEKVSLIMKHRVSIAEIRFEELKKKWVK